MAFDLDNLLKQYGIQYDLEQQTPEVPDYSSVVNSAPTQPQVSDRTGFPEREDISTVSERMAGLPTWAKALMLTSAGLGIAGAAAGKEDLAQAGMAIPAGYMSGLDRLVKDETAKAGTEFEDQAKRAYFDIQSQFADQAAMGFETPQQARERETAEVGKRKEQEAYPGELDIKKETAEASLAYTKGLTDQLTSANNVKKKDAELLNRYFKDPTLLSDREAAYLKTNVLKSNDSVTQALKLFMDTDQQMFGQLSLGLRKMATDEKGNFSFDRFSELQMGLIGDIAASIDNLSGFGNPIEGTGTVQAGQGPSLEEFIAKAGAANPTYTRDMLIKKYEELYGAK